MTKLQELEKQLQEQQNKLADLQAEIEKLKQAEQNGNQWVPIDGDLYYFLSNSGRAMDDTWIGNGVDTGRLSIGNVFRTREEAEFEAERLKVIAELKKYAREFVRGGDNFQIIFDYEFDKVSFLFNTYLTSSTLYFESQKTAVQAVQAVGEDRVKKYYLGVE